MSHTGGSAVPVGNQPAQHRSKTGPTSVKVGPHRPFKRWARRSVRAIPLVQPCLWVASDCNQRDREVFFLAKCFLEAWGTKATKPHMFRNMLVFCPCRLRRPGQKTILFWNMCGFLALVPQASPKTTWPRNHFGIPLMYGCAVCLGQVSSPDVQPTLPARAFSRIAGWADLGEYNMINPAPVFWLIFGPSGPTAGPGSLGRGSGSKNNPGCTKNQFRRPILRPVRAWPQKDGNINDKSEAPQGQPSRVLLFYVTHQCFRAGNRVSGPDFG